MPDDSTEQLLDTFKAAALSVTKLYKKSAAAQQLSRAAGYQECLEDLISFLDAENIGLGDGEGWRVRSWATERLDDGALADSEDEFVPTPAPPPPPPATASSPVKRESPSTNTPSSHHHSHANHHHPHHLHHHHHPYSSELANRAGKLEITSSPVASHTTNPTRRSSPDNALTTVSVPTQDQFTFQLPANTSDPPNLATLDLSDSSMEQAPSQALANGNLLGTSSSPSSSASSPSTASSTAGHPRPAFRSTSRHVNRPPPPSTLASLGRGAGHKRKLNFAEIFDLGDLGNTRDVFGGNGSNKRGKI